MEYQGLEQIISAVGFPIVAAIGLAIFIYKAFEKITDMNRDRESKLYEVIGKSQAQLDKLEDVNEGFMKVLETYADDNEQIKKDIAVIKAKVLKGEDYENN